MGENTKRRLRRRLGLIGVLGAIAVMIGFGALAGCASRPDDGQSGISVYGVIDEGVSLKRDR